MRVPHVIPYQGSKRNLANRILGNINFAIEGRLYEPFAGSAAITLAGANKQLVQHFVMGDKFAPLMTLWDMIISDPEQVCNTYKDIWTSQLGDPKQHFLQIRKEFNQTGHPVQFLYLIARCVKNAIRFNADGAFNQSPDNRRLGRKPTKMATEVRLASGLLRHRVTLRTGDFMEILEDATPSDVVYMDPPYQGTSTVKSQKER